MDSKKSEPALKLNFLSHGTLECRDVDATRKFYAEFMGLDVVRTSPVSLMIRLGGDNTIAVVKSAGQREAMSLLNHNGLDVETEQDVDRAHTVCVEQAAEWGLHKITKPRVQHGTYSFYFWDLDDNCWEILTNPKGGYSWMFDLGDLDGRGHLDKNFERPRTSPS